MDQSYKSTLNWGESKLIKMGIGTAHLDALVLLEDVTYTNRVQLLTHPEKQINTAQLLRFRRKINQRAKQLPLAYIRGKTEFYGREFKISPRVLEPRPESEALIDEFKRISKDLHQPITVVDVGTGSGALIITAKLESPGIEALAVDIDQNCLKLARKNAAKYGLKVSFIKGDLLSPLPQTLWKNKEMVLIANLPYVPSKWKINASAAKEPKLAIFGGSDGLSLYRKLFKQLSKLNNPSKWVLCESMPPQHQALAEIAAKNSYKLVRTNDFVQVFYFNKSANL